MIVKSQSADVTIPEVPITDYVLRHADRLGALAVPGDLTVPESLDALIARHAELTGSRKAAEIIADAEESLRHIWRVAPKSDVAKISQKQEGTLKGARA